MAPRMAAVMLALAVAGCGIGMPASYHSAVSVSYEMENGAGGADASRVGAGYIYYLQAIETGETPVGLQDFLHCKCKAYVEVGTTAPEGAESAAEWMAGYSHTFPWLGESISAAVEVSGGENLFAWTALAGYMTPLNLQFNVAYTRAEDDAAASTTTETAVWAEYAPQLAGKWWDFVVRVAFVDEDGAEHTDVGLNAAWYAFDELAIGLSYAFTDGDVEESSVGFAVTSYSGALSVGVEYGVSMPKGGSNVTSISTNIGYRF